MHETSPIAGTKQHLNEVVQFQSGSRSLDIAPETGIDQTRNKEKNAFPIWQRRPDLTWIYREGWPWKLQVWGRANSEVFEVLRSSEVEFDAINNLITGISKLAEEPHAQDQFYLDATLDERFNVLTKESLSKEEIDVILHNAFLWGHKVDNKYIRKFWEKASKIDPIQNPLLFERVLINFLSYLADSPSLLETTDLWQEAVNKISYLNSLTESGRNELLSELNNHSLKTILATVNTENLKDKQKAELVSFLRSLLSERIAEHVVEEFLTDVAKINDVRDGIGPKVELNIEEAKEVLDDWDLWHELLSRGVKPNSNWWERESVTSLTVLRAIAEHKKELLRDAAFLEGIGIRDLGFYRPHIYIDSEEKKTHQRFTMIDTNLCRSFLEEKGYYFPDVDLLEKVVLHMVETYSFDSMLTALFQMPAFRGKVEEAGGKHDLAVYITLMTQLADHLTELNVNHPYIRFLSRIVNRDFQLIKPFDYWATWYKLANFVSISIENRPHELVLTAEEMFATGLHPKAFYPYGYDYIQDGKFHDIKVYDTDLRNDADRRVRYERLMRLGALHLIERVIQVGKHVHFQDEKQRANYVNALKTGFLYFINPDVMQDEYIRGRYQGLLSLLEETDPGLFKLIGGEKLQMLTEVLASQQESGNDWLELQLMQLEIGAEKYLEDLFEAADLGNVPEVKKNQDIGISINVHMSSLLAILKSGGIKLPLYDKQRAEEFFIRYESTWNSKVYISKRGYLAHESSLGDAIYGALYDPTFHKYGGVSVSLDRDDNRLQRYGAHFFVLDPDEAPRFTVTPWDSFTDVAYLGKGPSTVRFLPGKYPYMQQTLAFQRGLLKKKGVDGFNNMSPGFYSEVQLYPPNGEIPLSQIKELHISWDHLKEEAGDFIRAVKILKEIRDKASRYGITVFVFQFDKYGNKLQKKLIG